MLIDEVKSPVTTVNTLVLCSSMITFYSVCSLKCCSHYNSMHMLKRNIRSFIHSFIQKTHTCCCCCNWPHFLRSDWRPSCCCWRWKSQRADDFVQLMKIRSRYRLGIQPESGAEISLFRLIGMPNKEGI